MERLQAKVAAIMPGLDADSMHALATGEAGV